MVPNNKTSNYQPFLIAGPRVGLERDLVPFMLPNDAFPTLENFYMWRGRVQKKGGTTLLGRLGHRTAFFRAVGAVPDTFTQVLPSFEVGSAFVYTTNAAGTVVIEAWQDNSAGTMIKTVGAGPNGTVNYTTSTVSVIVQNVLSINIYANWQATTDDNSPVMGLRSEESYETGSPILQNRSIGFDLLYAYRFNDNTNVYEQLWNYAGAIATTDIVTWSGSNSDFFTSTNWASAFWATNFIPGFQSNPVATTAASGDGIRWYADSTTAGTAGWVNFLPPIDSADFLLGARFLIVYKDRLLAINTWEGPNYAGRQNFAQRIRWSWPGTPFYVAPTPTNQTALATAWRDDVPGRGDFRDVPTNESITGALIIRDDLIIFCEKSKWRLVFTGDTNLPFVIQQIDSEFGCQSPYSVVPVNQTALAVAYNGISETDGVTTSRVDELIPDQVFEFHNRNDGELRVHGIRDYYTQFIYWTYTDDEGSPTFPNRSVVYNYLYKSWSIFRQQFTTFGYYKRVNDLTWGTATNAFFTYDIAWGNPAAQANFPLVIGGNQHGYVLYLENELTSEAIANDNSLSITGISAATPAIITVPNHGLELGQWIRITGVFGVNGINNTVNAWKVYSTPSVNTITIIDVNGIVFGTSDVYIYGGKIALIDNFDIQTKRFPLYMNTGQQTRVGYVDLLLDAAAAPALFTIDFFDNENYDLPVNTLVTNAQVLTAPTPERVWVRVYLNGQGQFFALRFYLSPSQISNIANATQSQTLHALILWAKPAARWIT